MNDEELDLKEIITVNWNRKVVIVICMIIAMAIGMLYSFGFEKEEYTAEARIIYGRIADYEPQEGESQLLSEITFNKVILSNYKNLMLSNEILTKMSENLNLDEERYNLNELKKIVKVGYDESTLVVRVSGETYELSKDIANELVKVFLEKSNGFYQIQHDYIVNNAIDEYEKTGKVAKLINAVIFPIVVAGIMVGYSVIEFIFNPILVSEDDIERVLKINSLGKNNKSKLSKKEYLELVKVNIDSNVKDDKIFFITSLNNDDAKNDIANNLAKMYSEGNKNVLLVNLSHSNLAFEDINFGNDDVEKVINRDEDFIHKTKNDNLDYISIINRKKYSIDLYSNNMFEFIDKASKNYDNIFIIGDEIESSAISKLVSAKYKENILVVKEMKTKLSKIEKIKNDIKKTNGNILGCIID